MDSVKDFYTKYNYPKSRQYTNKQKKHNIKIISKILSYANLKLEDLKNKKILVCGCGTGEKAVIFAKYGAIVTAIDFSSGQLLEAKKRAKENKVKINFIQKDIIKDDFNDINSNFDIVVSLGVLHHTENAYLGFSKINQKLKKNGIIIIGLYHKYSRLRFRIIRWFIRTFISKDPQKILYWLTNSYFAKNLRHHSSINTLYDRYCVPFESYHTLKEVRKWYNTYNIEVIDYSPNVKGNEILKIFEKKSIFFVGGRKK